MKNTTYLKVDMIRTDTPLFTGKSGNYWKFSFPPNPPPVQLFLSKVGGEEGAFSTPPPPLKYS